MEEQECFPFICEGSGPTEEIAWERFEMDARKKIKWVKGIKIWRRKPELHKREALDNSLNAFRVVARITALESLPEGYEEINLEEALPK